MRKLGYALIDDELKIVDSGILLQQQKSPTRQDQFERMSQIYDFFFGDALTISNKKNSDGKALFYKI